jgi:regulator of protease activity HflC (stomatin/prohibitin superfamily)
MDAGLISLIVSGIILFFIMVNSPKVAQEYERGVVFFFGRLRGSRGPGLFFIIPFVERVVKVDLRTVTLEVPTQEAITKDNVTVRVNAVLYFRVYDPSKAVINITDFVRATLQISQTTLRSVLGQSELDEVLAQRDKINQQLQQIIDEQTEPWGIKVSAVEIKDVELPQTMQRAMARQAEAEREKRAKIIHAEGEFQASKTLAEAANVIGREKQALQLRYLQTLGEIATEKNSTIIFPLPIDLIKPFVQMADSQEKTETAAPKRDLQSRLERRKRIMAQTTKELPSQAAKQLPATSATAKANLVFDRAEQELVAVKPDSTAVASNEATTATAIPTKLESVMLKTKPESETLEEVKLEVEKAAISAEDETLAEVQNDENDSSGEAADASSDAKKKEKPQPIRTSWTGKKR